MLTFSIVTFCSVSAVSCTWLAAFSVVRALLLVSACPSLHMRHQEPPSVLTSDWLSDEHVPPALLRSYHFRLRLDSTHTDWAARKGLNGRDFSALMVINELEQNADKLCTRSAAGLTWWFIILWRLYAGNCKKREPERERQLQFRDLQHINGRHRGSVLKSHTHTHRYMRIVFKQLQINPQWNLNTIIWASTHLERICIYSKKHCCCWSLILFLMLIMITWYMSVILPWSVFCLHLLHFLSSFIYFFIYSIIYTLVRGHAEGHGTMGDPVHRGSHVYTGGPVLGRGRCG